MEKIVLTTVDELKELLRSMLAEERLSQVKLPNKDDPDPDGQELLSVEEACTLLRIKSRSTLYSFIKTQRLPYIKIGKKTLFKKNELLKFLTKKSTTK